MRRLALILSILTLLSAALVLPTLAYDGNAQLGDPTSLCPGSLPTRLVVGGRGEIAESFSSLRDGPGGAITELVPAPAQFTVLAGPVSDGWLCYYQITYDNGVSGWVVESQLTSEWGDNMYWLNPIAPPPPVTPEPLNPLCPGGLPNLLTVGGRGYVVSFYSTLRDSPGGAAIQRVFAPAQFTVLAGPATDGFLCYYQIQYDDGATGWASESQLVSAWGSNMYWLAPIVGETSAG